jgi:DNA-directed RNA polymerase specialized sigma24 family protein
MSELSIEAAPPPLSEAEIRREISSLTAGERTRLIRIASYYGRISFEEPDELVQEAIYRVLAGMREWPRDLEKLGFLAGVIKSIAGDRKRALGQTLKRTVPLNEEREVGEARRGLMDYEGTEARGIRAKLDVKRIMTLFDDDPIAQKIVMGMVDGARGEELEQASGLSPTEYESKRKKIRRRIEKLKT